MNLGWCDVCLKVNSTKASRAFYTDLGFRLAEGSDEEGWAVITNGEVRLGLFEPKFMGENSFTLNFRGGDVAGIAETLAAKGHAFESGPKSGTNGGASATLRDPDGYTIFFDSAPGEVRREAL
jgi:lactoylglutathione lyase